MAKTKRDLGIFLKFRATSDLRRRLNKCALAERVPQSHLIREAVIDLLARKTANR